MQLSKNNTKFLSFLLLVATTVVVTGWASYSEAKSIGRKGIASGRTDDLAPAPGTTFVRDGIDNVMFDIPGAPMVLKDFEFTMLDGVKPQRDDVYGWWWLVDTPSHVSYDLSMQMEDQSFVQATGEGTIQITGTTQDLSEPRKFEAELFYIHISGSFGAAPFILRNSPTLPSTGTVTITDVGGLYDTESLFGLELELSLDGGATWYPAVETTVPEPASAVFALLAVCSQSVVRLQKRLGRDCN